MELKLSNVLYNFEEFYNRCNLELSLPSEVNEKLEELNEKYYEKYYGNFNQINNRELAIEILEFILEEFRYFKSDVFDYTVQEILNICPNLVVENYDAIYDKLIKVYDLFEEIDTIGVGGYNVDFDSMMETNLENYIFSPNEIFTLKDEWKDGNEGEYFVIEDRDDAVLASPNWEKGLSIIPSEVIKKFMIAEIMPYMKQDKKPTKTNIEKALEQLLIEKPVEFSKCYIITDVPVDTPQRIFMEIPTQEKTPVFLKNKIYDLIGIQFEVEILPTSNQSWYIYINEKELGVDERRNLANKIKEFADKTSYLNCETSIEDLDIDENLVFSTRVNGDVGSEEFSQIDLQEANDLKKKLLVEFNNELKSENIEIDTVDEWVNLEINFKVIN
jgi:hypothetical protein